MERDFKGVWIPKEIWLDERLNALDKVILTEIDSLDQGESGCYASNKYIAEFCQCSERKVTDAITKLIKLGYIRLSSFDGRTRILQSCIEKSASLPRKICEADTKNLRGSTIENNTVNNTKNKENADKPHRSARFVPPTFEEVNAYCVERQNGIDAQAFIDFYESKGWMIGKDKMKSWKAAVRTWENRRKQDKPRQEVNQYAGFGDEFDI